MVRLCVEQAVAMRGEDPVILVMSGAVHSFVRNHAQVPKIENIDLPAVVGRSPQKTAINPRVRAWTP